MKILISYSSKNVHKVLLEGTENRIVVGDILQTVWEENVCYTIIWEQSLKAKGCIMKVSSCAG